MEDKGISWRNSFNVM